MEINQKEIFKDLYSSDLSKQKNSLCQVSEHFESFYDRQNAWKSLFELATSEKKSSKINGINLLGLVFPYVPNKEQAWDDLHKLTYSEDILLKWCLLKAIRFSFSFIPDKQQAWEDLVRLGIDNNKDVRMRASYLLGSVFPSVPNQTACGHPNLNRLSDNYW